MPGAAGSYHSFGGMENKCTLGGLTAALPSLQPQPPTVPPAPPRPFPLHSRDILQTAYPLAWAPLWLLSRFASSVRTEGKNVFSRGLGSGTGEPPPCWKGEGSRENPAPQGSRSPGSSSRSATHSHSLLCPFSGLSFPTCQTSTKPKAPSNLAVLEFRVSDSGPEWSFRTTTGRVEVLEEEKGNQGRLPGGRGMRTQTQRLDHPSAQRPLPLSAEP